MTRLISITIVVLLLVAWLTVPESDAQQNTDIKVDPQLNDLLTARRDTLQAIVNAVEVRYRDGTGQFASVADARDKYILAELELAKTKQQRIELCKKRIDNLRELEKSETVRSEKGTAKVEVKMLATAARLQAEIDCVREQATPE